MDGEAAIFLNKLKLCLAILGVFALGETVFFYREFSYLGFPDGHVTELDRVRKLAYPVFSSWFFLYALFAFFVGMRPARNASRNAVIVFGVVMTVLNAIVFSLDHFFGLKFENGAGGLGH